MKFDVLVSTMNQTDYELIKKMNIQSNAVIVNQNNEKNVNILKNNNKRINWINSNERGLSKSRNVAIEHSLADICLLADDDLIYINGYENIILECFKKNPRADIISFQVEGINKKFKKYFSKKRKLNYLTLMKVSSVEIAFRRESIIKKNIKFDELFGAGAKYIAGEENIFLTECLKKGLEIVYVPVKIADLYIGESTWFNGYDEKYFISRGAIFTAMSELFSIIYILQFAIRKHKIYHQETSFFEAVSKMLEGRKEYLSKKNNLF